MSRIPSSHSHGTPTPSPAQSNWDEESFFNDQYLFPPSGSQTPMDLTQSTSSNASMHLPSGIPSSNLNTFTLQSNPNQGFPTQQDNVYRSRYYPGRMQQIDADTQQIYAAPSHQYDQHKQQAGFAVDAVKYTLALNPPGYDFSRYPSFSEKSTADFTPEDVVSPASQTFDFNTDFNFDSRPEVTPTGNGDTFSNQYINPAVVGGQEALSPFALSSQGNTARVYPGIHRQTAMAKAQAQAHDQPHRPENSPTAPSSKSNSSLTMDPVRKELIARLLRDMRDQNPPPPIDDDAVTLNTTGTGSQRAKSKKDLADMDADELLLNSEEGKSLPSKERRQLRNKVSARAFRHRRKEYILQLEEELEAAQALAESTKIKNDKLMAENTSLAHLCQWLLSAPEFSSLVNGLANPQSIPAPPSASNPETMLMSSIESAQLSTPQTQMPLYHKFPQPRDVENDPHLGMAFV